jgi:diguanylate cyclase (GGDEF)-like protein
MAAKSHFYQDLSKAADVQSAAEVLCAYLRDSGISEQPRCLWHLHSPHYQVLGHQSLPPMNMQVMKQLENAASEDFSRWRDAPVVLARHRHSHFILDVNGPAGNPQALDEELQTAAAMLRYLLARHQCDFQQQQLMKSEKLQQALFDISNLAYNEHDTAVLFRKLHGIIAGLVYAENFFIVNYNESKATMQFLYYADSVDKEPVDPDIEWDKSMLANSVTLAMLQSKQFAWDSSEALLDRFGLDRDNELGPESVDWMGIPMLDNGVVVGGLVIQSYLTDKRYTQADLNLMSFVAEHIRQSLTRRAQTEELERMVDERTAKLSQEIRERERSEMIQSALFNITRLASQSETLEQFYPAMHDIVGQLLDAKNIYVAFIDGSGATLHFPYYIDERSDDPVLARPVSNGLTEWVLHKQAPVLLSERDIQRLKQDGLAVIKGSVPQCWLGVPLLSRGRAIGVIALQSYESADAYSSKEQELLMFVSSHIAQALEKIESSNRLKQAYAEMESNILHRTQELELSNQALREQISRREEAEQKLKYDAMHDQLTGLANRNQLYERLKQSLSLYQNNPARMFAVFFIDLDRFKIINDSMGHWVGDELLKTVAERILRCVRKPDLVARLGGDEFAVILNSIRNINESRLVAERMLNEFDEAIFIQGKELFITPSIGIAISHERHHDPDEILRDSDIALYRSKELGRNRFTFFDDALHQSALKTLMIEGDLRRGLARSELFPHYQPISDLVTGRTLGFEALMRWRHPERGILLPADFSDIAKETGLIEQIDWCIYEQVCRDLPILLGAAAYVSINVSPRHLGHENFANRLLALLAEYGVSPDNLTIEVTEDALIEHPELGLKLLTQLKHAGFRINLDDFGTGYSSFSYLHKYPLDCLKIDRSFIATLTDNPNNKTYHLIHAIHALGLSLGLNVIAEGVETEAQRECLMAIGVKTGQGHLFTPSYSIEEIGSALKLATP